MLTVRHIQTETVPVLDDNKNPVLDANKQPVTREQPVLAKGQEIVLWSVPVPREIEAQGGGAIDAYVASVRAKQTATPAISPTPAVSPAVDSEDVSHE